MYSADQGGELLADGVPTGIRGVREVRFDAPGQQLIVAQASPAGIYRRPPILDEHRDEILAELDAAESETS